MQKVFRVAICLVSYPAYSRLDAAAQTDIKVQKLIAISGAYCQIGAEMLRAFLTAICHHSRLHDIRWVKQTTFFSIIYIYSNYCQPFHPKFTRIDSSVVRARDCRSLGRVFDPRSVLTTLFFASIRCCHSFLIMSSLVTEYEVGNEDLRTKELSYCMLP